jgi:hypothetical protein
MRNIETDYLVVGGGAAAMSFVDVLLDNTDADIVIVERRHRPGGHWIDSYPFVRLHQPSATFGVMSRPLGEDRIDETGPNQGFYERATAAEICAYYLNVLENDFLPSGRVRFYGMSDYRGETTDGHHFVSLVSSEETVVNVRRKLVDCTYAGSEIPAKTPPTYEIDGARVIPPNDLVDLGDGASGYTVIGAGKTSMDACVWLLEQGVDPDRIRWIRPRDVWGIRRALMQPLDLVAGYVELQASWVKSAAEAKNGADFGRLMESEGVFVRIDPDHEPAVFRGPILSDYEVELLRQIENVVRLGYVRRVGTDRVVLAGGEIESDPDQIYVNCTASGLRLTQERPIFGDDRITMQVVTLGNVPWSSAQVAFVEATREDDDDKNRLCPVVVFDGDINNLMHPVRNGMIGLNARGAEPDIAAWDAASRLNVAAAVPKHMEDPRIPIAFSKLLQHLGPAMENLDRMAGAPAGV